MIEKLNHKYAEGLMIKPSVEIRWMPDGLRALLNVDGKNNQSKTYRLVLPTKCCAKLLDAISNGCSWQNLNSFLISSDELSLLTHLEEKDLLTGYSNRELVPKKLEKQFFWLSEFYSDSKLIIEKIGSSSVLILGCGGIGSVLVEHLLASGVCKYILVDSDLVEESNFNRQFPYRDADIGNRKVDSLAA